MKVPCSVRFSTCNLFYYDAFSAGIENISAGSMIPQPAGSPSLKSLKAVAAVAQAGSIAGAATLLGVTASAVSHLVADAEAQLAVKLFERSSSSIRLTKRGRELCERIAPAFDLISDAVRLVKDNRSEIKISTVSTFASHWLIPRLTMFQKTHPDINVFISATTRVVDLDLDGVDGAIRYGAGDWKGMEKRLIFRESLIAVGSPSVVGGSTEVSIIKGLPRIGARHRMSDWEKWTRSADLEVQNPFNGVVTETRGMAIDAVLNGSGVLVIDKSLVANMLASGRLVQIGSHFLPLEEGYWIVWSKTRPVKPAFKSFANWMLSLVHA